MSARGLTAGFRGASPDQTSSNDAPVPELFAAQRFAGKAPLQGHSLASSLTPDRLRLLFPVGPPARPETGSIFAMFPGPQLFSTRRPEHLGAGLVAVLVGRFPFFPAIRIEPGFSPVEQIPAIFTSVGAPAGPWFPSG